MTPSQAGFLGYNTQGTTSQGKERNGAWSQCNTSVLPQAPLRRWEDHSENRREHCGSSAGGGARVETLESRSAIQRWNKNQPNWKTSRDFPGGPWWLRLRLPMQGVWVWSLIRMLRSHMPHSQKRKQTNHKTEAMLYYVQKQLLKYALKKGKNILYWPIWKKKLRKEWIYVCV